jgi:hypothetical protein
MRAADDLGCGAAVDAQPFGVDAQDAEVAVEKDEPLAHAVQDARDLALALAQRRLRLVLKGAVAEHLEVALARAPEPHRQPRAPEACAVALDVPALVDRAARAGGAVHLAVGHPLGLVLGREEQVAPPAHRLLARPAQDALGAAVPAGDDPGLVQRDDGEVVRPLHDAAVAPFAPDHGRLGAGPPDRRPGALEDLAGERDLLLAPVAGLARMDVKDGREPSVLQKG